MPRLLEKDIQTREVLDWRGIHLLHFTASSCSQKTRIFLNLKGIDWKSHPVNLGTQQNYTPWFLGINPRGLVPVLVHDGAVYIESNDILTYLETRFPDPPLIPPDGASETASLLREEDDLHLDVRSLTMRFVMPKFIAAKKPAALATYEKDHGTIEGHADPRKEIELRFWNDYADHGISDAQATHAAGNFRQTYETLETRLAKGPFLLGEKLSVVDIAWFIYTHRLRAAGYPFPRLHPAIHRWYLGLAERPEFRREVKNPAPLELMTKFLHIAQSLQGKTLVRIAGL